MPFATVEEAAELYRRGELVIDPVAASAPEVISVLALIGAYRVILAAEREPARARRQAG